MTEKSAARWCILRMSPSRTLAVADALKDAGYDAWTPAEELTRRIGHARKRVTVPAPLLPSFVFARYDRLADLVAFSRAPALTFEVFDTELRRMVTKGCPFFRVFRHEGKYPWVSDRALDALRLAEQRGKPIVKARVFQPGEAVKCPDAGFDGLTGVVTTTRGRRALVCFEGFAIPISIPNSSLLSAA